MESWHKKIRDRLQERGFSSLNDFLAKRPGVPYPDLAIELGRDVLGLELVRMHLEEAKARGEIRSAAIDSLVRCIRQQLPQGWSRTPSQDEGVTPEFMNITAWSYWSGMFKAVQPDDALTDAVWARLREWAPTGWLPESVEDEIIRAAFNEAWPVG